MCLSSHKMYNNDIVNFQESTTKLNACTKKSGNLLMAPRRCAHIITFILHVRFWYIHSTYVYTLRCTYIYYEPHGNIFIQRDGIAIGSVLGPVFRNFYTSALVKKVFDTINKPNIYLRYADDILLLTNSSDEINTIQETFQNNSVLSFTQEINTNNKIPFLGVLIDTSNIDRFITSTYIKTYQH